MSDRLSPEELARLLQQDRERGVYVARTREMAEAQTLEIPPRSQREDDFYLKFAYSMDGYDVCKELTGRNLQEWSRPILWPDPQPDDWDGYPARDVVRRYSLIELRLILFALFRSDYMGGGMNFKHQLRFADTLLDIMREKLGQVR